MATLPGKIFESKNSMTKITQAGLEFTTQELEEESGCSVEDISSSEVLACLTILIGFILILENSLLIFIICRTRSLPNITNILVASTGFSDVLAGAQCFIMGVYSLPGGLESWLDSTHVDKHTFSSAMLGINCSLMVVSMPHVSLLAIDRYLYVLWPFHYVRRVTKPRVLGIVCAIWILALVYFCVLVLKFQGDEYRGMCIFSEVPTIYSYYPLVLLYYLCFIVVCVCTFGMIKLALDHRRRRRLRKAPQTEARVWRRDTNGDPHSKFFDHSHTKSAARSAGAGNNSDVYLCLLVLQFQGDEYHGMCIFSEVPTIYSYYPLVLLYYLCFIVVCVCTFGMIKLALDHRRKRILRKAPQTEARVWRRDTNGDPHSKSFDHSHTKSATRSAGAGNNSDGRYEKRNNVDPIMAPIVSLILGSSIKTIAENSLTPFQEDFRFINMCHSNQHSNYFFPGSQKMNNQTQNVVCNLDMESIATNQTLENSPKRSFCQAVTDIESVNSSLGARVLNKLTIEENHADKATTSNTSPENTSSTNYKVAHVTNKYFKSKQNDLKDCSKRENRLFNKANLKIIKFVLVVFGSYFLCTFPSIVLITIVKIMNIPVLSQNGIEFDVMHLLLLLNSGMNFFIITYMNKDFRIALAKTLPCCRVCCAKHEIKRRHRQGGRQAGRQRGRQACKHAGRQAGSQADRVVKIKKMMTKISHVTKLKMMYEYLV
ncbi:beta-1-adrenergic receptor [Plakobranchus ocellatus]|uniref:Beta-1-adrenergic receptor n=1 Tax=Plakobranchus ocellatus TaxID=259542 RepID=A0AAV4BU61_9GAST|nr:beta-1-adrenergic receptor [Plakobranchus ocellatus]